MKWFFTFILLNFGIAHAQELQVVGKVSDSSDNRPLAGAIVRVQNTNKISATNTDGNYRIKGLDKGKYILSFSSVGFETKEIPVSLPEMMDSAFLVRLDPAIEDMEAVVVTGTRTEMKLKESPVFTQVIYPNNLKDIGITNVAEALENEVPGLDFNSEQTPLRPSLTFQGMDSKYVLFLLDGERIAGEINGDIDYSMLNLNNVDRIEIVRGASSALYGSNAIGGVINIITRKPVIPFELSAFAKYSKFNELESGTTISRKGDNYLSLTSLAYNQTNGYQLPDSGWIQCKFKNASFSQKFDLGLSKKLTFSASGRFYFEHIYDASGGPADDAYSDMNGNAKLFYEINDSTNLQLSYYNDDYTTYGILVNDNNKIEKTGYDFLQDVRLSFNNAYSINRFTSGIEYFPEQLNSNGDFIPKGIKRAYESVLFGQDEIKINSTFSTIIGFRATDHSTYGLNFVPKFAIMAKKNNLIYRLSYGFGYRSPSFEQMYYNFYHKFGRDSILWFQLKGNPGLKPEKSQYIGYSVELNESWVSHSINIYYNRVRNLITDNWSVINGIKTDKYTNDSSATIIGIDIMEKMMPFKNFMINGGISLVDARNNITGQQLYNISPVSANLSGSYSFMVYKNKTTFKFSGKYNGFRYYTPETGETINRDRPYNIWKASITQQCKNFISFTFGIDNIFNVVNSKSFDNLSPGRRFFIAISLNVSGS